MKKLMIQGVIGLMAAIFIAGCIAVVKDQPPVSKAPTTGQQLVDLKHAKDVGAISDEEYATQKAKLLGMK